MGVEKAVFAESVLSSKSAVHTEDKNLEQETKPIDHSIPKPGEYKVIRRNNKVTSFDSSKISVALTKAFLDVEGGTAATVTTGAIVAAEATTTAVVSGETIAAVATAAIL